ncbi:MAG: UvrD-helicase domain-containing protein [Bacteroidales bacterium]|nr:UvrD-helicase domain-containing protein [Bacteroidales bacterium]
MIKILRSSAGSGKTFNLAKTYIRLLLSSEDRYAYRHILAVTFTNKATAEMKNRILKELDILAREPEASGYISDFGPMFGGTAAVQKKASALLKDILHDYSAFSVSTIDKFFQQALRAFARELGQFSSYQVELDKDALVHESVDRILSSVDESSSGLRNWLTDSLMAQIEENGRFSLENTLYDAAGRIKDDSLREELERCGKSSGEVFSRDYLKKVRSECSKYVKEYKGKVQEAAKAVFDGMKAAGLVPGDFHRYFNVGFLEVYLKPLRGALPVPTDAFFRRIDDSSQWFTKANQRLIPQAEASVAGPLAAFRELFTGKDYVTFRTAELLKAQVYSLGLASEVEREFASLQDEKNVICIDDSNLTLRNIIAGSDAPFIYEKLGVRFENFLLDEFQDTSAIQWENFRPLLAESDASGGENLLVGDVKQSIYRWRGGDWKLLSGGVKEDFPSADDSQTLQQNWRSLPAIVHFNNDFFTFAARMLDMQCGGNLIQDIYADAVQEVKSKEQDAGFVNCTFCASKEEQMQEILSSVAAAREAGASLGQIAILVRTNTQGSEVASFLLQNGVHVISDDSMKVKSSVTVRRLVSLLYCIGNEKDLVNRYVADSLNITLPSRYDSLYSLAEELLRSLREADAELFSREVLYVQSFMDLLLSWSASNGNSLVAFLKYWNDEDPKIASPEGAEAVRVLTIHKSKGLEFPYVIYPFAGDEYLYKSRRAWCAPNLAGTALEGVAEGVYDINLSQEGTASTCFDSRFREEQFMQYIDGINTFYVALTRAGKVLHTISAVPSSKFLQSVSGRSGDYELPAGGFKRFSELLYWFTEVFHPEMGSMPSFRLPAESVDNYMQASFDSWPLKGRMRVGGEAKDLLRLRGIAMHKILSDVTVASDLPLAVERAVASGLIEEALAPEYESRLRAALDSVSSYHWFDIQSVVLNETGIIDTGGELYRPDRVVIAPDGTVTVIDYKFGEEHPGYAPQVRRYCRLFRDMGYTTVSGYLWFVPDHRVLQVL